MARKSIESVSNVHSRLNIVNFQFEYSDGSKEQFKCPGSVIQKLTLAAVAQSNFTVPQGDLALRYRILRADATGRIAILLTYPGNKTITMALDPQAAKQMGKQLLKATEPHPDSSENS